MKTILFARVSSREQEASGYSLPSQEKLLESYARNKDLKIVKKFTISESASGQNNRTIFNSMLEYAKKNKVQIIICEKVDRLTRNIKDAVCVNEWINGDPERQVHFVKEGCVLNKDSRSNEKFIWNIKVSVAQFYIDNLSEEVKKGQIIGYSGGGKNDPMRGTATGPHLHYEIWVGQPWNGGYQVNPLNYY